MEKKYLVLCMDNDYNRYYLRPDDLQFTDTFSDNVIWQGYYYDIFNVVYKDSKKFDYVFVIREFDTSEEN